jgi:hypothetical protein
MTTMTETEMNNLATTQQVPTFITAITNSQTWPHFLHPDQHGDLMIDLQYAGEMLDDGREDAPRWSVRKSVDCVNLSKKAFAAKYETKRAPPVVAALPAYTQVPSGASSSAIWTNLLKSPLPCDIINLIWDMATPKHDELQYARVLNEFQKVLANLEYLPTLEMAIDHNRLTRKQFDAKHGNLMEQEMEEDLAQDRWGDAERTRLEELEMMYQEGDDMLNE